MAGIAATAAAVCLFQLYLRLVKAAHDVENRLERLQWLETQARDGLLTDEETRAEVLLLTR
ncbi:MAG: hypothetical protein KDB90_11935 [Planctomycetes bacterium]|nr:hypothetical protein [Planctomycetota bacterium]